jgi:hypothetical protein
MRDKTRVRKPNPCKAKDAHVGIGVLKDALCEKDQAGRKADEQDTRRALCGREEEPPERAHRRSPFLFFRLNFRDRTAITAP